MKIQKDKQVTIAMRTYNRPIMLARGFQSVMNQSYSNWKLVLVNNGGNPKDIDTVISKSKIDKSKLEVIHNDSPESLGAALNQAFVDSPGKYAAVHDDDDTWHPKYLEKCIATLNQKTNPRVMGVVTYIKVIEEKIVDNQIIHVADVGELNKSQALEHGGKLKEEIYGNESLSSLGSIRLFDMMRWCIFVPTNFVYEQKVFDEIGKHSETKLSHDLEFVLRFLSRYLIQVIPEYLANRHIRINKEKNDYTNVVCDKPQVLAEDDTTMENEWLIDDLKHGRLGLGFLSCLAKQYEILNQKNDKIIALLNKILDLKSD